MSADDEYRISPDQLQIGVYVHLDVGWMIHPFSFNNFKIRTEDQLHAIRGLGLDSVRWDPARSDIKPLPRSAIQDATQPVETREPTAESAAMTGADATEGTESSGAARRSPEFMAEMALKQRNIERLAAHREMIGRVEHVFTNAAAVVRGINKSIHSQPEKTVSDADQLITGIVDDLLAAPELAIQVMAEKSGSEDAYFHSLNVSVLSMILGRELKLPADVVKTIGVGALFHDIGLNEIPAKILNKADPLTKAEREFRELHCQYGHDIGKKAGLPPAVLNIIMQHHENFDGSGYPRGLKGEAIDPLARVVAIVNAYDNLCNPTNIANALTPHEALSLMFAQQRSRHDPRLLQAFIRFMGVYPPGTVVGLSNDVLALVIKINSARPLKPVVIIHDESIPRGEAMILDLEDEADINVSRAIRPAQLPPAVFDYLSPRKRVSYYFDATGDAG